MTQDFSFVVDSVKGVSMAPPRICSHPGFGVSPPCFVQVYPYETNCQSLNSAPRHLPIRNLNNFICVNCRTARGCLLSHLVEAEAKGPPVVPLPGNWVA